MSSTWSALVATILVGVSPQDPRSAAAPVEKKPPALACRLQGGQLAARTSTVGELLSAVTATEELSDGYAFRFPSGSLAELARFVDEERRCCPFFTFELVIEPELGPVWLRLRGPRGVKEVLEHQWLAALEAERR